MTKRTGVSATAAVLAAAALSLAVSEYLDKPAPDRPMPLLTVATVTERPSCVPDPTCPPPKPSSVNCSPDRLNQVHEGRRCDEGTTILRNFPNDPPGDRTAPFYGWVLDPKPKPVAACAPANVCGHQDCYTCRCKATGPARYGLPCDWYLSEKTDLP
jgi:hypothetical protein